MVDTILSILEILSYFLPAAIVIFILGHLKVWEKLRAKRFGAIATFVLVTALATSSLVFLTWGFKNQAISAAQQQCEETYGTLANCLRHARETGWVQTGINCSSCPQGGERLPWEPMESQGGDGQTSVD